MPEPGNIKASFETHLNGLKMLRRSPDERLRQRLTV
jgi:hypothetical protein